MSRAGGNSSSSRRQVLMQAERGGGGGEAIARAVAWYAKSIEIKKEKAWQAGAGHQHASRC